jgi:methylenetetrahydrofolate reductase (NADPH)
MAHLTGLCHTTQEIESIADQLWEAGIRNIMALRGDRPKDATVAQTVGDFNFAQQLISFLAEQHDFCLGGACYPEGHKETRDIQKGIEHLKLKIDAGCEFLVTQMFFENENYFRFVEQLRTAGLEIPVIPGIMPITGFAQIDKFENQFGVHLPHSLKERVRAHEGDEEAISQVGVDWSAEQCQALLDGGAPGIHFYTLNKSSATVNVCLAMGLKGSRATQIAV